MSERTQEESVALLQEQVNTLQQDVAYLSEHLQEMHRLAISSRVQWFKNEVFTEVSRFLKATKDPMILDAILALVLLMDNHEFWVRVSKSHTTITGWVELLKGISRNDDSENII